MKKKLIQPIKLTKIMQDFEFDIDNENIFNSFKYIDPLNLDSIQLKELINEQKNDFLFDSIINDIVQPNTKISKIDTFLNQNQEEHKKKKKQVIPKNIKKIVWNTYIGSEIIRHKCLCCKKVTIENTFFECGHVISEKDGGTLEISNLRPICSECNRSMGCKNMIDYVKIYGLFIG